MMRIFTAWALALLCVSNFVMDSAFAQAKIGPRDRFSHYEYGPAMGDNRFYWETSSREFVRGTSRTGSDTLSATLSSQQMQGQVREVRVVRERCHRYNFTQGYCLGHWIPYISHSYLESANPRPVPGQYITKRVSLVISNGLLLPGESETLIVSLEGNQTRLHANSLFNSYQTRISDSGHDVVVEAFASRRRVAPPNTVDARISFQNGEAVIVATDTVYSPEWAAELGDVELSFAVFGATGKKASKAKTRGDNKGGSAVQLQPGISTVSTGVVMNSGDYVYVEYTIRRRNTPFYEAGVASSLSKTARVQVP